jgi:hypothetical protein
LENYNIGHVVGCIRWTIGIAFTISKEGQVVSAHNAILIPRTITEAAGFMTANISNLNIFVPF